MEDKQKDSLWISIKDRLPEPHEKVLVYGLFMNVSSTAIEGTLSCEQNRRLTEAEQKRMARCARGLFDKGLFDKCGFQNPGNIMLNLTKEGIVVQFLPEAKDFWVSLNQVL